MERWYALHCLSNTERRVTDKLAGAGIESFYPYVDAKSADKRRIVERKFFPGYAFAHFDLVDRGLLLLIPQIVAILGFGAHVQSVPDAEIEAVRQLVNSPHALESVQPCPYVAAGDRVRVERGPLQGLEGFVVYEKASTARVVVSVSMLHRSVSAEVDRDSLSRVQSAPRMAA
jgi:transcriptional antiterminator NusG